MLIGDVVFCGEAAAKCQKVNLYQELSEKTIVFTESLTTEVAFYVLNNPVVGIITEESSFATHGANILRCMMQKNKKRLVWITGIMIEDMSVYEGKYIHISINGEVLLKSCKIEKRDFYKQNDKMYSIIPMKKRSIVEYDISNNCYKICYWPHRKFNNLTFSIWKKGLEKNMTLFGIIEPKIEKSENGHIWFDNAPLLASISEQAKDYLNSEKTLNDQIALYDSFYKTLNNRYFVIDIIRMSIAFFSNFLLFHDTYEDVFEQANQLYIANMCYDDAYKLMNLQLSCKIDNWMLENNLVLIKKKSFLSDEQMIPVPTFSIYDDIRETINGFEVFFNKTIYHEFWNNNKKQIIYFIKCFVAKEWKFVMLKMLSTRFSEILRRYFPYMTFEQLGEKNIDFIIRELEIRKIVNQYFL